MTTTSECRTTVRERLNRPITAADPDPRITPADIFAALRAPLGLSLFDRGRSHEHYLPVLSGHLERLREPGGRRPSLHRWLSHAYTENPGVRLDMLRVNGITGGAWIPGPRTLTAPPTTGYATFRVRDDNPGTSRLALRPARVLSADDTAVVWCEVALDNRTDYVGDDPRYAVSAVLCWKVTDDININEGNTR